MESRRARMARFACGGAWLAGLATSLSLGLTVVEPAQLFGLLIAVYLGTWGLAFAFSPRERALSPARFLACSAAIILVLLPFELAAFVRAVDFRAVFANPMPAWQRPENRPDPDLLYVRRGDQQLRRTFLGDETHRLRGVNPATVYRSDLKYDRNGFRNVPALDSAGTIVIGDSFIEGAHVSAAEVITARLSRELGEPVANLGRTGYGPQQELQVLRRYGLGLHPRTCLLAFYEGNDLDDSDRYESDRDDLNRQLKRDPSGTRFERSFTRNCLLFVIRRWLSPEPRWPAAPYTGQFAGRAGKSVPIYFASGDYRSSANREPLRSDAPRIQRIRAVLEKMHDLCRREEVLLVVVFIPTKWRVYRDLCTFDPDSVCSRWAVDDLPGLLKTVVASVSAEVGFVDLTQPFRDQAKSGSLLYLNDDTHWSNEGHQAAAVAIADFLGRRDNPPVAVANSRGRKGTDPRK